MINCNNISIISVDSTKVYLHGTITGLDASKEYCIKYDKDGSWVNAPNKYYNYTYFANKTSFDLGDSGVYADHDPKYTTYAVTLHEVSGNCENILASKCIRYISIPVDTPGTYKNIPPEVVDVMPSGTTKILSFKLTPIVFFGRDISDISSAKSGISGIARSIASFLTLGGYTGWNCLGSDVVELANNDVMLLVFLKEL